MQSTLALLHAEDGLMDFSPCARDPGDACDKEEGIKRDQDPVEGEGKVLLLGASDPLV